jgi:hypothetical protein
VRRRPLWFFHLRKSPQISYYAFSRVAAAQPNGLTNISKGGRKKGPNSMICVWWYEMRLQCTFSTYNDWPKASITSLWNVWHKIICKRSSCKKEKISLIFVEIVENWKPVSYSSYIGTTQDVFSILITRLLKFVEN